MTVTYPAAWSIVSVPFNGKTLEYVVEPDGTHYSVGTPVEVIRVLEMARRNDTTIRVFYGDQATGRDWMEEYDTIGTVNRSMGPVKVPLIIKSSRSMSGGAILTASIVRITIDKRDVYRHPTYHHDTLTVGPAYSEGYAEGVYDGGKCPVAQFEKIGQAARYIAFMYGDRNAK